jgi:hypothetical protein
MTGADRIIEASKVEVSSRYHTETWRIIESRVAPGGDRRTEQHLVLTFHANGTIGAHCSGSGDLNACKKLAEELTGSTWDDADDETTDLREDGGADMRRESCQQLAEWGLLTGRREALSELVFGAGVVPNRAWYERPTGEGIDPTTARHIDEMRCIPEGGTERSAEDRACGLMSCNLGYLGAASETSCACVRRPAGFSETLANELVRCVSIDCPPGSHSEVAGSSCVCVTDDTPEGRAQCEAMGPVPGPPGFGSDLEPSRPFCPAPPRG